MPEGMVRRTRETWSSWAACGSVHGCQDWITAATGTRTLVLLADDELHEADDALVAHELGREEARDADDQPLGRSRVDAAIATAREDMQESSHRPGGMDPVQVRRSVDCFPTVNIAAPLQHPRELLRCPLARALAVVLELEQGGDDAEVGAGGDELWKWILHGRGG